MVSKGFFRIASVKTVLLLRHAKSAWDNAGRTDQERPRSRRGERAAEAMAEHIAQKSPRPDLILCSTAIRSRQTLAPLVHRLTPPAPPILLEKGLYLALEATLLARLQDAPRGAATALRIGPTHCTCQPPHASPAPLPSPPLPP